MALPQLHAVAESPRDHKTNLLVVGAFENRFQHLDWLDKALDGALSAVAKRKEFTAGAGQTRLFTTLESLHATNVLVVGLGDPEKGTLETLRAAAAVGAKEALCLGVKDAAFALTDVPLGRTPLADRAQAIAEGALLGLYQFTKYKTQDADKRSVEDVRLLCRKDEMPAMQQAAKTAGALSDAVYMVRDLINEPPNVLTPQALGEHAKTLAKLGVKVTVHEKKAIEKLGMNALLAVNSGSAKEPRLIVLEYGPSKLPPIALVGKGITFDSGGLDIKGWPHMVTMKCDMSGAATVIGIVKAAASLKLGVHLVGVIVSTENMPDGNAFKAGDIYRTYSGKTIEIVNTDAEGRVALCDGLAYVEKNFKPKVILDFATLTGACRVALGNHIAGVMGNSDQLYERLYEASQASGERIWRLPLDDEFKEEVKGDLADVRNLGRGDRAGGALSAAAFLAHFVEKTPWMHFDIAGPAFMESLAKQSPSHWTQGATGFGVRTIVKYLQGMQ